MYYGETVRIPGEIIFFLSFLKALNLSGLKEQKKKIPSQTIYFLAHTFHTRKIFFSFYSLPNPQFIKPSEVSLNIIY